MELRQIQATLNNEVQARMDLETEVDKLQMTSGEDETQRLALMQNLVKREGETLRRLDDFEFNAKALNQRLDAMNKVAKENQVRQRESNLGLSQLTEEVMSNYFGVYEE